MRRLACILLSVGLLAGATAPVAASAAPAEGARSVDRFLAVVMPPDYLAALGRKVMDAGLSRAIARQPDLAGLETTYPGILAAVRLDAEHEAETVFLAQDPVFRARAEVMLSGQFSPAELKRIADFFTGPTGRKVAATGMRINRGEGGPGAGDYDLFDPTKPPPEASAADAGALRDFYLSPVGQRLAVQYPQLKKILLEWIGSTTDLLAPRMQGMLITSIRRFQAEHPAEAK